MSRWGHESSIAALLGLPPLALMLWANIIPGENRTPRPIAVGIPEPDEQILHKVIAPDGLEAIWLCII